MSQFNNSVSFRGYCNEILTKSGQRLKFFSMVADMHGIGKKSKKERNSHYGNECIASKIS